MTQIAVLSDLHVEHRALSLNYGIDFQEISTLTKKDVFCIPGDISDGIYKGRRVLEYIASKTRAQIVMVMGNHDYIGHDLDRDTVDLMRRGLPSNVHVLDNEVLIVGGVRILGCTLWTSLADYNENDKLHCAMPDYNYIYAGNELITPDDTRVEHAQSVEFLSREMAKPFKGKTIMMSHHAPSWQSGCREKRKDDALSSFFYSDLDYLIQQYQPSLVVHGHTHCPVDYQIGLSRVINQPMPEPAPASRLSHAARKNPSVAGGDFAPKIISI
jgi:predicted phosphodiesterase